MPHVADQFVKDALAVTLMHYRQLRGFSQEQLAEVCGLSRVYISMLERQERLPRLDTLLRICAGLEVGIVEFMTVLEEKRQDFYRHRSRYRYDLTKRLAVADSRPGRAGVSPNCKEK